MARFGSDTVEYHGSCVRRCRSPGTVRVILVSCLQEKIKTVANASMENLYDQGRASPPFQSKEACPVQSGQMESGKRCDLWGGDVTIILCKHLIGSCTKEGEKLL